MFFDSGYRPVSKDKIIGVFEEGGANREDSGGERNVQLRETPPV